nr:recombinase family protein [Streptomyces sp. SID5468]
MAGPRGVLERRARVCADHADRQRWEIGGWFVDTGDAALLLNQRPNFERLMRTLAAADKERPRVCLVHDWDRISHDRAKRTILVKRLLALGARVETCFGERILPDGRSEPAGLLPGAPLPR